MNVDVTFYFPEDRTPLKRHIENEYWFLADRFKIDRGRSLPSKLVRDFERKGSSSVTTKNPLSTKFSNRKKNISYVGNDTHSKCSTTSPYPWTPDIGTNLQVLWIIWRLQSRSWILLCHVHKHGKRRQTFLIHMWVWFWRIQQFSIYIEIEHNTCVLTNKIIKIRHDL